MRFLSECGLEINQNDDEIDWSIDTSRTIMRGLMSARMSRFDTSERARMSPAMQRSIAEGENLTAEAIKQAPILRGRLYRQIEELLAENYLLLSPTVSGLLTQRRH